MKRTYRWYMHPNCLDICLRVAVLQRSGQEDLASNPEWWNLGYTGQPWYVEEAIFPRNFDQWIEITEYVNVPRVNSGLPGPYQVRK